MKSLSRKIALFIGILIILISLALGLVAVKLSSDALLKQTEDSMLQYAEESANLINSNISQNLAVLGEVALRARTATMDFTIQKESLTPDIKRLGYESMAVVLPSGMAQDIETGQTTDLKDRDYIKRALAGTACISDVVINKLTGEPAVMEAAPIISNNKVVGVLIGRRDGNFLSGITNELGTGERGYAFVLGEDSTIYAHPNKQFVLEQRNVFDMMKTEGNDGLGGAIKKLGLGTLGMANYTLEGETRLTAMAPIPNTDWTLGVGNYKSDVMKSIMTLRNIILVIALAVIALGIAAAIILGRFITNPIRNLKLVADKLALGEVDVTINAATNDEIGDLMISFGKMIDNIKYQSEVAERIAIGDLNVEIEPKSEKDLLAVSMKSVIYTLRALIDETRILTASAAEGDLNTRGNVDAFEKGYREILEGFNHTLDGIVNPLNIALAFIQKVADGDELEEIENDYRGQYGVLINNLMMVKHSLNTLVSETDRLTRAAFEGEFSYQPDLGLHKGVYAQIMISVNDALDYIISPFRKAGEYMRLIGNGVIPEKITEEYKGEFKDIVDSINTCIDGLGALVEGRDILGRMGKDNDYSIQVEGNYLGIYAEIAESTNLVSNTLRRLVGTLNNIALGDLSDLEWLKPIGRRSENDTLMPAIIMMIENIQDLILETLALKEAVVEGQLDTRSDSSEFNGAWRDLVDGMNHILEEVAKPLKDVTEVMNEISNGNLKVSIQGAYQGDFDVLTKAVDITSGRLSVVVSEISDTIEQIADSNLALNHVREFEGDFARISNSLNVIIDSLNMVMGDINDAAEQVSSGSIQVSDGSQTLSQGSTEQASSIQELTASITEIASQTKQNAVNANQANGLATDARDNAEKGNDQMKEMLKSMEDISESSVNISKIIKVIDDIAFQTNILALNAAVEAARAGQHGKGFAVVAEEVRSLAARSAEAAKDTTELIEGSIRKVQAGTKIANETADALNEIVIGIEKAAELVGNIAIASNEQASGIAQINKGIEQVSQVVQNNSATAEESAAASEQLSSQAELMKEMVGKFKLKKGIKGLPGLNPKLLGDTENGFHEVSSSGPKILLENDEFDKY